MTPLLNSALLSAPLAVAIPAVALVTAHAPYGWWHVLAVYLLAGLPLSVLLAHRIAVGFNVRATALVGLLVGAGLGLATLLAGHHLSKWLHHDKADLFVRQGVLGVWCLLLQLPWCLVGRCTAERRATDTLPGIPSATSLLLALCVASGLPVVHLWRVIESESKKLEEIWANQLPGGVMRGQGGWDILYTLAHVGSPRPVGGETPGEFVRGFHSQSRIHGYGGIHQLPLMPDDDSGRMEWARNYAAQGSLPAAEEILIPLSGRDPAAALLLAAIYQEQKKWKECSQYCRLALALLERLPRTDEAIPGWVQAYETLATAAYQQQRYDEARMAYEEAIRRVQPAEAHFHFQLGRLHHTAGRPGKALHHLEMARKLDPEGQTAKMQKLIDDIRMQTPGCLLRWFGS